MVVVNCQQKKEIDPKDRQRLVSSHPEQIQSAEIIPRNRGRKLAVLTEIVNATAMEVMGDKVFVLDEVVVHVYSLKDFRLLNQFGRKGKGPGEFEYYPTTEVIMQVTEDKVILSRMARMAEFSHRGTLLRERRKHPLSANPIPVGTGTFMRRLRFGPPHSLTYVALLDRELEEKRMIYSRKFISESQEELKKNGFEIFRRAYLHLGHASDRLYIYDPRRDNRFFTFDEMGNPRETIKLNLPRIPVSPSIKKEVMEWVHTDPVMKEFPQYYKIVLPRFLPAIKSFRIKGDRIYIQTYAKKRDFHRFYITDLKGNIQKELYLPTAERAQVQMGHNKVWDFHGDGHYYLQDNYQDETWDLYRIKIK